MIVITDRSGNEREFDADAFAWAEERYSMLTLTKGGAEVAQLNMDDWSSISYVMPYGSEAG